MAAADFFRKLRRDSFMVVFLSPPKPSPPPKLESHQVDTKSFIEEVLKNRKTQGT
jgi:hypothetical protein